MSHDLVFEIFIMLDPLIYTCYIYMKITKVN